MNLSMRNGGLKRVYPGAGRSRSQVQACVLGEWCSEIPQEILGSFAMLKELSCIGLAWHAGIPKRPGCATLGWQQALREAPAVEKWMSQCEGCRLVAKL